MKERVVLGIDPGTHKCGFAVLAQPGAASVGTRHRADRCARRDRWPLSGELLAARRSPSAAARIRGPSPQACVTSAFPIEIVDERETTLRARRRYFEAHPPTGWRRLIPRGMLLPPVPIDDFAALLIAERLLEGRQTD